MEAIYARYAAIVRQFGGEPVDLQTFAVSGLLADFLEWERRTLSWEGSPDSRVYPGKPPFGSVGRPSYFGLYRRHVKTAKATAKITAEENAWISYLKEIRKHPALASWGDKEEVAKRQEATIARAKETQATKRPWRKKSATTFTGEGGFRQTEQVPITPEMERQLETIFPVTLTESQQREVDIARQYQAMNDGSFERFIQLHGYNPLLRYRQ